MSFSRCLISLFKKSLVVLWSGLPGTREGRSPKISWQNCRRTRQTAAASLLMVCSPFLAAGIIIDSSIDFLRMKGADSIYALGDCTATSYAPTAQVASQQGAYLARMFNLIGKGEHLRKDLKALEQKKPETEEEKQALAAQIAELQKQLSKVKLRPFDYSHQGSLAYIGSDKAIADLPFMNGNVSLRTGAWI